jgi:hypothetical protein
MRLPIAVLVVAAATSFAAVAAADVVTPQERVCSGKQRGDFCDNDAGYFDWMTTCPCTCQDGTCYRGAQFPDGGWGTTSFPCQLCQHDGDAAAAPDVGPTADAGPDAGIDAGTSAPAAATSGGCGMSRMGPLAGAFGIAMAVPLLLRRRRRS